MLRVLAARGPGQGLAWGCSGFARAAWLGRPIPQTSHRNAAPADARAAGSARGCVQRRRRSCSGGSYRYSSSHARGGWSSGGGWSDGRRHARQPPLAGGGSHRVIRPRAVTALVTRSTGVDDLASVCLQHGDHMDAFCYGAAMTRLRHLDGHPAHKQQLMRRLLGLVQPLLPSANARTLTSILYAMGFFSCCSEDVLTECLQLLTRKASEEISCQDVSNTLWALAKLSEAGEQPATAVAASLDAGGAAPVTVMLQQLVRFRANAKSQEISSALWSLSKLAEAAEGRSSAAAGVALGCCGDGLGELLQQLAVSGDSESQHIANSLWALARLYYAGSQPAMAVEAALASNGEAVGLLLQRLIRIRAGAKSQEISNSLWALARLSHAGGQPAAAVAAAVAHSGGKAALLLQQLTSARCKTESHHIATSLWALAKLSEAGGQSAAALVATLADTGDTLTLLLQHLVDVKCSTSIDAANALWALVRLADAAQPQDAARLHAAMDDAVMSRLLTRAALATDSMRTHHVPSSLFAAARLRLCNSQFARHMQQAAREGVGGMTWQGLSKSALAAVQLALPRADEVISSILVEAATRVRTDQGMMSGSLSWQELCNVCWAASTVQPPVLTSADMLEAVSVLCGLAVRHWDGPLGGNGAMLEAVHQKQLCQLAMAMHGLGLDPTRVLPLPQLQQCQAARRQGLLDDGERAANRDELSVEDVLREGVCDLRLVGREVPAQPDGLMLIDFVAEAPDGRLVAVEVDGPSHFVRWLEPDGSRPAELRPTGDTLFRNAQLQLRGYTVVPVPWTHLFRRTKQQRRQALTELLTAALISTTQHEDGA